MLEARAILAAWQGLGRERSRATLATVVHVQGSAYRRPGARMLILPDGRRVGTLSGGCLEGDVARKASWWTSQTGVALRTFDTSSETAAWDFGLGCNGIVTVLLENAANPAVQRLFDVLGRWQATAREGVVATVIRREGAGAPAVGDRCWMGGDGAWLPVPGDGVEPAAWSLELREHCRDVLRRRRNVLFHADGLDVFLEWVGPPQRLVVFGAGHDAVPVVSMAALLGWHVTVVDGRPAYAQLERFPGAEEVHLLSASGEIAALSIDSDTAVVLMTHNYPLDRILLPKILAREPKYLGLLGPRSRAVRLFRELEENLEDPRVHAPVGVDLGADFPEGIALAIVAEVQAVRMKRPAGFLRDRSGPIHSPALEVGEACGSEQDPMEVGESILFETGNTLSYG